GVLLLGGPGKPGIELVCAQDAFQRATYHNGDGTFFHKTCEHFAQHGGLLHRVYVEGLECSKRRAGGSPYQGWSRDLWTPFTAVSLRPGVSCALRGHFRPPRLPARVGVMLTTWGAWPLGSIGFT